MTASGTARFEVRRADEDIDQAQCEVRGRCVPRWRLEVLRRPPEKSPTRQMFMAPNKVHENVRGEGGVLRDEQIRARTD